MGNNPMAGATVACAVAVYEAKYCGVRPRSFRIFRNRAFDVADIQRPVFVLIPACRRAFNAPPRNLCGGTGQAVIRYC